MDEILPRVPRIRKPVQRAHAERYLLYTLLSFAVSVSLTRLFLNLTGFPQLGGGGLHIAHVLWGGLLLFVAALVPLLFANGWAYNLDAILAGVGVGLFIDEVGKFITQNNNYFYPPAAPIIYAFFLLTVLVYVRVRRPRKNDPRSEMYAVLEDLEEVLDQDLSETERNSILHRLTQIEQETCHPDLARLIDGLKEFIACDTLSLVPQQKTLWERGLDRFKALENRWINQRGLQVALSGWLFAMGLWALFYPMIIFLAAMTPENLTKVMTELVISGLIKGRFALFWFEARLGLQISVALILMIASVLLLLRRDRRGIDLSYLGLLLSLTTVNLLMFYFDQFSTIVTAVAQFALLLAVLYYRGRYLRNRS